MCSVNTFSGPGATECSKCNEVTEYAGNMDKKVKCCKTKRVVIHVCNFYLRGNNSVI